MSLADRVKTPPRRSIHGRPCSIGALIEVLADEPEELAALQVMLHGSETVEQFEDVKTWHALRADGYDVGRQSIGRHRRGDCRCARDQAPA
jgi:hypothetical protein